MINILIISQMKLFVRVCCVEKLQKGSIQYLITPFFCDKNR